MGNTPKNDTAKTTGTLKQKRRPSVGKRKTNERQRERERERAKFATGACDTAFLHERRIRATDTSDGTEIFLWGCYVA